MSQVDFQSQQYFKFCARKLYVDIYYATQQQPILALCNHQYLLLPIHYDNTRDIHLIQPSHHTVIQQKNLKFTKSHHLYHHDLRIAKAPIVEMSVCDQSIYLQTCLQFCDVFHRQINHVLNYLYAHLQRRSFRGKSILHSDAIQFAFAKVRSDLELACVTRKCVTQITEINLLFQLFIQATETLIKLSGGRAVLKGNTIEMIFHLRLFQMLFLTLEC